MLFEFSLVSPAANLSREDLREITDTLERAGLKHIVGPLSVCVEGEWESVMNAIGQCHRALFHKHGRLVTNIRADDHAGRPHSLHELSAALKSHFSAHRGDLDSEC